MAFAPIGSMVDKVIDKSVGFVSIIGPGLKYVKTAKKVTKFSNPVKATTYTAGMLLEICVGKYEKYSVLCAVWATTTTAGLVSGNPALIAVGLEAKLEMKFWRIFIANSSGDGNLLFLLQNQIILSFLFIKKYDHFKAIISSYYLNFIYFRYRPLNPVLRVYSIL